MLDIMNRDLKKLSNNELLKLHREMQEEANRLKMSQIALKEQLNSAYGAMGCPYFRFTDVRLAGAITQSGKMIFLYMQELANKILNKVVSNNGDKDYVIAGDTDSTILNLEDLVKKVLPNCQDKQKIVDVIDSIAKNQIKKIFDKGFDDLVQLLNAYKQTMNAKREVIADKGVWTGKKRYMLNVYDKEGTRYTEPKMIIKGLEPIKSSTPEVCKKAIMDVLKISLMGTEDEVQKYVSEFEEQFFQLRPEEIALHMTVSFLKKYDVKSIAHMPKGVPYNSKASIIYNHLLKQYQVEQKYPLIYEGDKVCLISLKIPNICGNNTIAFIDEFPKEFKLDSHIDYKSQFNKVFLEPLERVLKVMHITAKQQNSLFSLLE